jgi:GxxExxY protein
MAPTGFQQSTLNISDENILIQSVMDAAFQVHKELGPGLFESVYEAALAFELKHSGLNVLTQLEIPVIYKGNDLGLGFRADILVEDRLLLELKSIDEITDTHLSQVLTYLRLLNLKRGYIFNFGKKWLKDGIKRISR